MDWIPALAADAVLVLHLGFIVFVVAGGALVWRHPWLAALHAPALLWGVYVEFSGAVCPLTPLENRLRALAGERGYGGGFVEHYLLPLIYPPGLAPGTQWLLGAALAGLNALLYAGGLARALRRRRLAAAAAPSSPRS